MRSILEVSRREGLSAEERRKGTVLFRMHTYFLPQATIEPGGAFC